MSKEVRRYDFPEESIDLMLPSGSKVVKVGYWRDSYTIWIEGDFDSNQKYWNTHCYTKFSVGDKIPGHQKFVGCNEYGYEYFIYESRA